MAVWSGCAAPTGWTHLTGNGLGKPAVWDRSWPTVAAWPAGHASRCVRTCDVRSSRPWSLSCTAAVAVTSLVIENQR